MTGFSFPCIRCWDIFQWRAHRKIYYKVFQEFFMMIMTSTWRDNIQQALTHYSISQPNPTLNNTQILATVYTQIYTFQLATCISYRAYRWSSDFVYLISYKTLKWRSEWNHYIQYIPRNMHTVFALLCFVVVIHWLIFPYPSGLLHWHCGNLTIAPVPAK